MKNFTLKLAAVASSILSLPAGAHPGHGIDPGVHASLHVEHMLPLAAVAILGLLYLVKNKN